MEKAEEFDSGQDGWQPEKRNTPLDSLVSLSQCIAQLRHQVNGLSSLQKRRRQRSSSVLSSPGSSAIDAQSLTLDDSPKFLNCEEESRESLEQQLEEARYQISLLKEGNVELAAELGETKGKLNSTANKEKELTDLNDALTASVKSMEALLRDKDSRIADLSGAQHSRDEEPPRPSRCGSNGTRSNGLMQADVLAEEIRAIDVRQGLLETPWTGHDSAERDGEGFETGSATQSDRTLESQASFSEEVPYDALPDAHWKGNHVDQVGLQEGEVAELKRMIIKRDMQLDELREANNRLKTQMEELVDDLDVKKAEVYYLEEQVMRFAEGGNIAAGEIEQNSACVEKVKGAGMPCASDNEVNCEKEVEANGEVASRHITVVRKPSDGCSPGTVSALKKVDTGFNELSYAEFSGSAATVVALNKHKVFSGEGNGATSYRAADQSDDSQSESCASDSEDCGLKGEASCSEKTASTSSSECSHKGSNSRPGSGPGCQSLKHSVLRFHHLCVKVGCKMNECVDSVDNLVEYTKKHPSDKPHISDSVEENISELSELNGLFYKDWALLRPMLLEFIEGMDGDNTNEKTKAAKPGEVLSSSSSDDEVNDDVTQEDADSASEIEIDDGDRGPENSKGVPDHGLTYELDGIDLPCASNPIPAWHRPSDVPKLDLSRVILAGVNTRIGQNDKLVPAVSPSSASIEKQEGAVCSGPVQQNNPGKVDWVIRNGVKVDANMAKIEQLQYEKQLILHDYNNAVREKDHLAADLEAAQYDVCVLQNEVFRKDEEKRFMCGQLHQVRMENVKLNSVVEELEVRNSELNENRVRITAENGTLKICKEVLTTELDDARASSHEVKRTIAQYNAENQHLKGNIARIRNDLSATKSHVEAIREALGRAECEKRSVQQQLQEKTGSYLEAQSIIESQTLENRRLVSELNRVQNSIGAPRGRRGGRFEKRGGRGNRHFKSEG